MRQCETRLSKFGMPRSCMCHVTFNILARKGAYLTTHTEVLLHKQVCRQNGDIQTNSLKLNLFDRALYRVPADLYSQKSTDWTWSHEWTLPMAWTLPANCLDRDAKLTT